MRRWFCVLCAVASCCVAAAALGDPYEVNPAVEVRVMDAVWGDGPGEFTWRGDEWGMHEVTRFGPFALDDSGRIYIAEIHSKRNEVLVFDREGRFVEAIPMLRERNYVVSDLAVYNGRIYWMPWEGEPLLGPKKVFSVKSGGKSVEEIEVTSDPLLTGNIEGRHNVTGNAGFFVGPEGLSLYARRSGLCYPLVCGAESLAPAEQAAGKQYGLPMDSGARIMTIFGRKTTALSGKEVAGGDVVRVRADGVIEKLLVSEGLIGVAGSYFLCDTGEKVENEWRTYWVLRHTDGALLSRTRHAARDHTRMIEIRHNIRLAADGSFYELFVDDKGVHVSRWVTQLEGR